jgi:hypothetical protein
MFVSLEEYFKGDTLINIGDLIKICMQFKVWRKLICNHVYLQHFSFFVAASRVAQKEGLTFEGSRIDVKLMRPSRSLPVVEGPFEDNLIFVSGLSPKCTRDDLGTFFSVGNTHSDIEQVTFGMRPGEAMLQFTQPPGNHFCHPLSHIATVRKSNFSRILRQHTLPSESAIYPELNKYTNIL